MEVIVHRGHNQIGGNIVEIASASTRILLDVGLELDMEEIILPAIDGLFGDAAFDAVFISHYHGDHLGLAYYIDENIPLYIGENSYRIVATADAYKRCPTISPSGFLKHGQSITIKDITVTPFLCDHSAFDSYMLLCECDGQSILYTGDFRSNGRKSFEKLLQVLPSKVDKLICEGTTLSRHGAVPLTEADLEAKTVEMLRATDGPVFVLQSSTNIDRIVTMYRAAKRSGRAFLEELYMAEITAAIGGSIPNPAFSDVFAFITNPGRYELLSKYKNRIGKERIAKAPFVMCVRSSMLRYLKSLSELMNFEGGLLIYSMWEGYKKQPQMQAFLDACSGMGLSIISLHTTGHADPQTIRALIAHTNPNEIIPIHTEAPEWFANLRNIAEEET